MYIDNDNANTINDGLLQKMSCGGCLGRRDTRSCRSCEGDAGRCSGDYRWGLENYPLASVYAPLQCFVKVYDREKALSRGTIFEELDLPFMGESVAKGGCGCGR